MFLVLFGKGNHYGFESQMAVLNNWPDSCPRHMNEAFPENCEFIFQKGNIEKLTPGNKLFRNDISPSWSKEVRDHNYLSDRTSNNYI